MAVPDTQRRLAAQVDGLTLAGDDNRVPWQKFLQIFHSFFET